MFLVAGLGNPGKLYEHTRHNVGFDVIDLLADKNDIEIKNSRFNGLIGKGSIGGKQVMLLKPLTYMNLSGECVMEVMNYYKLDISSLIVIYDDVDLELGKLRIRRGGSAGTHNGMKSVIYKLQKDIFCRIRVGIGQPDDKSNLIK